jgi:hypothetical protein
MPWRPANQRVKHVTCRLRHQMHEAEDHMLCLEHKPLASQAAEEVEPHQQQPALLLQQQPAYGHVEAFGQQVRAMSRHEEQSDSGRNQDRSDTLTVDPGHSDDRQHYYEEQHVVKFLRRAQVKQTDKRQTRMGSQQAQPMSHLMDAVILTRRMHSSHSFRRMLIKSNCKMIQHRRMGMVSSHQAPQQNGASSCVSKERLAKPRRRYTMPMHDSFSFKWLLISTRLNTPSTDRTHRRPPQDSSCISSVKDKQILHMSTPSLPA